MDEHIQKHTVSWCAKNTTYYIPEEYMGLRRQKKRIAKAEDLEK